MKPEEIHLNDWQRILLGEVPFSFIFELIIRAAVIYLILMFAIRLMGKRMSSQLSRNEMAAMVSLAAAVGVPMMAPDRGLLPAVVIAMVLILIERVFSAWATKNEAFEKFSQGNISMLIKDGVVDVDTLKSVGLSRERLFAQLRSLQITHLGTIKRFYMEASGTFTLIKNTSPAPGLPTMPGWDEELQPCFEPADGLHVCGFCGQLQKDITGGSKCSNCGKNVWMPAIRAVSF